MFVSAPMYLYVLPFYVCYVCVCVLLCILALLTSCIVEIFGGVNVWQIAKLKIVSKKLTNG